MSDTLLAEESGANLYMTPGPLVKHASTISSDASGHDDGGGPRTYVDLRFEQAKSHAETADGQIRASIDAFRIDVIRYVIGTGVATVISMGGLMLAMAQYGVDSFLGGHEISLIYASRLAEHRTRMERTLDQVQQQLEARFDALEGRPPDTTTKESVRPGRDPEGTTANLPGDTAASPARPSP